MNEMTPDIIRQIPQLEAPLPAENFEEGISGTLITVLVVLIALGALLGVRFLRNRQKPVVPPSALDRAMAALEETERAGLPLKECSLRLSYIIREYMTGETQDPALYETHEEFSERSDLLTGANSRHGYAIHKLLEELAELKYAGLQGQHAEKAAELTDRTRQLIQALHQTRQQADAGGNES